MIQIIKKGTRKIVQCQACGCEMSYEDHDVLLMRNEYNIGYDITGPFIICPQCNHAIELLIGDNNEEESERGN